MVLRGSICHLPEHIFYVHLFTDSLLFFPAFNSTAGAGMALGIILSAMVYQYSRHIWYLDASVALCIAVGLFGYGLRLVTPICAYTLTS